MLFLVPPHPRIEQVGTLDGNRLPDVIVVYIQFGVGIG
jgi:hypothetical protein